MNNEVKLKGLAGLAHLLSPGADWAYDNAARNVRDYVKEQTLALAAKDAENNRIRHVLQQLLIDSNGKIRADHWNRAMSALEMNDAPPPPHPDTARLDKLPQCFHELRFSCALGASPEMWWFTRTPSTIYYTVREAIDAHVQPGERNSGGTPE